MSTTRSGRLWRVGIFLVTLGIYALFTPRVLRYTEPPTGDQPYYLQTVISLVEDGDLNEYNNIIKGSYDQFYPVTNGRYPLGFQGIDAPYPLPMATHAAILKNPRQGVWYSKHGTGLPFALVPGWVIGKWLTPLLAGLTAKGNGGWPGTVFEMNVLGALLATQMFFLAREAAGSTRIALAVWAALAFSVPQMAYSYLLFPELPAALLIAYAYHQLWRGWDGRSPFSRISTGLCIGYLPWLHFRLIPVAAILAALALKDCWQSPCPGQVAASDARQSIAQRLRQWRIRELGLVWAPAALVALGVVLYSLQVRGSVAGTLEEHAGFFKLSLAKERGSLILAALGILFDQQYGLLIYAPVYALSVVGFVALLRSREWSSVAMIGAITVPYGLLVIFYRTWWGAWCPPARYLAPVLPLLAVPLARSLQALRHSTTYKVLYAILAGAGILIMAGLLAGLGPRCPGQTSTFFNNPPAPASFLQWLDCRLGVRLARYLPTVMDWFIYRRAPVPWWPLAAYVLGTLALVAWGIALLARSKRNTDQNTI